MKHIIKIVAVSLLLLAVSACSNDADMTNRIDNSNNVNNIIKDQIKNIETENNSDKVDNQASKPIDESEGPVSSPVINESDVDYDLTTMNSDMVYATVYQMMIDPDTYIGKTIRMSGLYYAVYYEPTEKHYHYCIIEDALSCCSQGMEFVWEDGSHIYPDEYPEDNTKVIVEGVFETYREDGDTNLYSRLKDATMIVIK